MELSDLDDLYRDGILDHCRNPRNSAVLGDPDATARAVNAFCGDEVDVQLVFENGLLADIGVQSSGCSINQAASSMLSEALDDKTLEDAESLASLFKRMMGGDVLTEDELGSLGDLRALAGVLQFPVRIKCALLSWSALEEAVEMLRTRQVSPEA